MDYTVDTVTSERKWEPIARQKVEQQHSKLKWYLSNKDRSDPDPASAIDIVERNLTSRELEITKLTATEIPLAIENGDFTAFEIAEAFCKRASFCTQLLSCCTEIMFEEALLRARRLDVIFAETGKLVGPLHGVPVSIKDCFDIEGVDTTAGWTALANKPVTADSPFVTIISQLGGIIYCKTNLPASIMTAESENCIFGRTKNPYHRDIGAGGSSGGEGALIAAHGSPLGVGSDVAGSIRIPALCCGVYGLRPSNHRFPTFGFLEPLEPGADLTIKSVAGPLANSVADLKLLMSSVCSLEAKAWISDPDMYCLPFRNSLSHPPKLRVGVLYDNGLIQPHPPIKRALDICRLGLEAAGHKVFVVSDLPPMKQLLAICSDSWKIDGFKFSMRMAAETGEEMINSFKLYGNHLLDPLDAKEILNHHHTWKQFKRTMNLWWFSKFQSAFDVLLCPGACHTALPHDTFMDPSYTVLWNCIDYPAGIIPVTKVDKQIDLPVENFKAISEADDANNQKYDSELLHGLPVGVQIVGTKLHEEELLHAMGIIDSVINDKNAEQSWRNSN